MLPNSVHPILKADSPLSAGNGYEALDGYEYLDLNHLATNGKAGCLAFPITGDSAVPHIPSGSIVIVDPLAERRNGDIIAASRNGLSYVKVLRVKQKLQLVSPNTKYEPITVEEYDDFHILGVVVWHGCRTSRADVREAPVYSLMDLTPTGDGSLFKVRFEGDRDNIELKVPREDIIKGVKLAYSALKAAVINTIPFTRKPQPMVDREKVVETMRMLKKPVTVDKFEF